MPSLPEGLGAPFSWGRAARGWLLPEQDVGCGPPGANTYNEKEAAEGATWTRKRRVSVNSTGGALGPPVRATGGRWLYPKVMLLFAGLVFICLQENENV